MSRNTYGSLKNPQSKLNLDDNSDSESYISSTSYTTSSNKKYTFSDKSVVFQNESSKNTRPGLVFVGSLALVTIATVATITFQTRKNSNDISSFFRSFYATSGESSSIDFSFTIARNGYDPLVYFTPLANSLYYYKFLENYIGIIEPYSNSTLEIISSPNTVNVFYEFTICAVSDSSKCYYGTKTIDSAGVSSNGDVFVNIPCEAHTDFTIIVNEYSTISNTLLNSGSGELKCIYVRREIRTLTTEDLDRTMDSMHTMWEIDEISGQKIYGSNYHSSTYLLEFHYFNAAFQESDHIHEGNGFMPQHIKMTNIFESSIQAVDPSITVPFWDFTIESSQNISVMLSPVFSASMFGSSPHAVNQYWGWSYSRDTLAAGAIQDGRWAYIKADKNDKYEDLDFAYGYLRAPWNMNPSPYLSRFTSTNKHLPTCASHYDMVGYTDIKDFLFQAPYASHAGTHGVLGGVFGCDAMDPLREAGYIIDSDAQLNLCKNWIFYLKEFFRLNYMVPQSGCTYDPDVSESEQKCGYICNDSLMKDFVFVLKNILNSDYVCVDPNLTDEGWFAWRDFICTGDGYKVFAGDHLEAASPADPSFWPIHPTLERLLQAKYLAGGFLTDDWPTDPTTEYVCDKGSCFDAEYGFDYWDYCCYGHFQDDQLLDAASGDKYSYTGPTNRDIMDGTDPTSDDYNMPYIYANFNWDHCQSNALYFDDLVQTLSETMPTLRAEYETSSSMTMSNSGKPIISNKRDGKPLVTSSGLDSRGNNKKGISTQKSSKDTRLRPKLDRAGPALSRKNSNHA